MFLSLTSAMNRDRQTGRQTDRHIKWCSSAFSSLPGKICYSQSRDLRERIRRTTESPWSITKTGNSQGVEKTQLIRYNPNKVK